MQSSAPSDDASSVLGPGETVAAVDEVDLVALPESGDGRPDTVHHARAVDAENRGQRSADRPVRAQLVVDRVDARCQQPHPDVPLRRDLRFRQLRDPEDLGAADRRHQYRPHVPPSVASGIRALTVPIIAVAE